MDVKPIQRFNIGDEGDLMQVAKDGCYVDYDDHISTVAALQARIAELEKDERESEQCREELHDRLREIAIVLKGPEAPGCLHGFVDLPKLAEAAKKDAARLDKADAFSESYGFEDHVDGNRWMFDGPFRTLRQSIDAMKG